jgi:cell division septation protein DedD
MRRLPRFVLLAALVAFMPALAGCENMDFDKFDFLGLNKKKPLPGDRKPLFPEGVPGVSQGIPKEYTRSYIDQQQNDATQTQPAAGETAASGAAEKKTAAVEPAEKLKPKPKPKRTAKHKAKPKPPATAATPANSSSRHGRHPASNNNSNRSHLGRRRRRPARSRTDLEAVMRELDPRIHLANTSSTFIDGLLGQARQ